MAIELEVKETFDYPEGTHEGTIKSVEKRTVVSSTGEEYQYVDIHIQPDDNATLDLKYGIPANLSKKTKLGQLLEVFSVKLKGKSRVDIEKILLSKRVKYQTITDKNGFVRVLDGSLKPILDEEE